MWNFESPTAITLKTVLVGHENGVYSVDLNETIIVSGAGDSTIKVHHCHYRPVINFAIKKLSEAKSELGVVAY